MTLIISMIYILTWIPNSVIFLLLQFSSYVTPDSPVDQLGILLVTFNSCINPIVYSLHSTPFSNSLKNMVQCCKPQCTRNAVVPTTLVTLQRIERDIDVTSYRNEDFVENRIESRLSERSHHTTHSEWINIEKCKRWWLRSLLKSWSHRMAFHAISCGSNQI